MQARRRTTAIAIACVMAALLVAAFAFFAIGVFDKPANQDGPTTSSAQQDTEPSTVSSASTVETSKSAEPEESAVLEDMQTSAPLRDGFDPATNISTTIAGVTFQIPGYFGARTEQGEGTVKYYYAESGSSLAMIMTAESSIAADADEDGQADDPKASKDSYLVGMVQSNEELFGEIVSSTDCQIAGHSARIATLKGTTQGLSITTKAVYFINDDLSDDDYVIGSIIFGQSGNVLLDCSADFAKTIASATPAK